MPGRHLTGLTYSYRALPSDCGTRQRRDRTCALGRQGVGLSGSTCATFDRLEADGDLFPVASTDVENLIGTGRIYGQRQKIHVALLSVRERR